MSTLNVANITDGTDTVETGYVVNGSAKAWVNFNGTGTVAVRDSMNVASLTDNGVGNYAVNISSAFSNANYSYSVTSDYGASILSAPTTSSFRGYTFNTPTAAASDRAYNSVALLGDLA